MKIYNLSSPFYQPIKTDNSFVIKQANKKISLINELVKDKQFAKILLYGQIQSGKTNFLIQLIDHFIDQYQDVSFIVLTDNNTDLMTQTHQRVKKLLVNKPFIYTFTEFKEYRSLRVDDKRIYFCLKENNQLMKLHQLIANSNPMKQLIIIDDESDVASAVENNKINSLITGIIKTSLNKKGNVYYFPITATPFDNCAISDDNLLKPDWVLALTTGENYYGLNKFHTLLNTQQTSAPIHPIKNDEHKMLFECIEQFLTTTQNQQSTKTCLINKEYEKQAQDDLVKQIYKKYPEIIQHCDVLVSSFNTSENFKEAKMQITTDEINAQPQIIIGCNKVSRGITFKDLSSIFLTGSEKINISTLLQRARWFGYRLNYNEIKIYLLADYIDYFIYIADLVQLQFYVLNNVEKLTPNQFNLLAYNFSNFKKLDYSKFKIKKDDWFKKQCLWSCDKFLTVDLKLSTLAQIIAMLAKQQYKIKNNNLVCEFSNWKTLKDRLSQDEIKLLTTTLLESINFDINVHNNNQPIIIRLINFDSNTNTLTPHWRKIIYSDQFAENIQTDKISLHNYTDEYVDEYFNCIVIDFVCYAAWNYANHYTNKKTLENYNYKVIVKKFINKQN